MKNKIIVILSLFLVLSCAFFCSCNKTEYTLELNYYQYELKVNTSFTLEYSGCPFAQFSSSNESVATVDQAGVVIAKAEGQTVITVAYEDLTKTCEITVVDTEQSTPILTINLDENVSLLKTSAPIKIMPKLTVDGKEVQAQFVFSSQREGVATVDVVGVITPIDYGTTAISVSAQCQGKTLQKTIILNVIADVDIRFDRYEQTIYTTSVNYSQKTYFVPKLLGVYVDGIKDESATVNYEFDQNLLKFENGVIEVVTKNSAQTELVAVYSDANGIEYTCPIAVNILFPVIDKTEEIQYYVGNWKDSLRGEKQIGREQITFIEEVFDEQITEIYDVTTGEEINLNYNEKTKELENTELVKGSKTWRIYNQDYAVEVSVIVVDMVINTAEEFVRTLSIATDEHIVIGRDIANVGHYQNTGNVFSGVLDGNYHTVAGIDFSKSSANGGLFSRIDYATIRNIAFKDVDLSVFRQTVEDKTTAYPHGLIGYQGYRSTISNVFAQVYSSAGEYEGGLFHWIGAGITIKDTVIVYRNRWAGEGVGVLSRTCDAVVTVENVYVVKSSQIALIKTFASALTDENLVKINENLQKINVEYNDEEQFRLYRNTLSLTEFHLSVLEKGGVGDKYENDDFID